MQTNPELYGGSVITAAQRIVDDDGPGFLLQGLVPTFVGYGIEGALKFGFYEACKPVFSGLSKNRMLNMLCASVVAGGVASIVLCPAEEVRISALISAVEGRSASSDDA